MVDFKFKIVMFSCIFFVSNLYKFTKNYYTHLQQAKFQFNKYFTMQNTTAYNMSLIYLYEFPKVVSINHLRLCIICFSKNFWQSLIFFFLFHLNSKPNILPPSSSTKSTSCCCFVLQKYVCVILCLYSICLILSEIRKFS